MENKKKTILVECTLIIPVEVPNDEEYDMYFDIEENHCPGTGYVGTALEKHIDEFNENGFCWACALKGECKIVEENETRS